jgi:hypothetical protein
MSSTAQRLSAAAAALVDVLATGHAALTGERDLVIAGQARDQVLACLTLAHRYLFAGLGPTADLSATDMLRHPILGLGEALQHRSGTGLAGPSPTDLALAPPRDATAQAWVAAAAELDAAGVEIARARPDKPQWAWRWAGLAPMTPHDQPPPGSPQAAWGLAADIAALAAGLAAADRDLAEAFGRAGGQFAPARQALTDDTLTDVSATARLALQLAETGQLPSDYHLPAAAVGSRPLVLSSAVDLPAAMVRTRDLILDGPTLTGLQQRALAAAVAATALALTEASTRPARDILQDLAAAATGYAAVWASSDLWATGAGDWAAVQQLRAVSGFVWTAVHGPHTDRLALDQADVARAAARLPGLLRAATANLRAGIDADAFLTSDRAGTEPAWWPLASHPARRRYRRAAGQLDRAADEAAEQLRPLQVPRTQTRPGLLLARDLLRPAAERAPDRPVHPALPPSPWQPSPRRSPGR